MTRRALIGVAGMALTNACSGQRGTGILDLKPPQPDARIAYGKHPLQFGDLRLPSGAGPHPLVIYIHGGFWKAEYTLEHAGHACAALTRAGAATWNLEYRRIGDPGGGWPGTCDDIAAGIAHASNLAARYRLDLDRIVLAGHSAGGHLACWAAAQNGTRARGVVSLAGVVDLRRAWELRLSDGIVAKFLGGSPAAVPARYRAADPIELVPLRMPQRLVHGTADGIVPIEISERFAHASSNAELIRLADVGHFELIDPRTTAWKTVEQAVLAWS